MHGPGKNAVATVASYVQLSWKLLRSVLDTKPKKPLQLGLAGTIQVKAHREAEPGVMPGLHLLAGHWRGRTILGSVPVPSFLWGFGSLLEIGVDRLGVSTYNPPGCKPWIETENLVDGASREHASETGSLGGDNGMPGLQSNEDADFDFNGTYQQTLMPRLRREVFQLSKWNKTASPQQL